MLSLEVLMFYLKCRVIDLTPHFTLRYVENNLSVKLYRRQSLSHRTILLLENLSTIRML